MKRYYACMIFYAFILNAYVPIDYKVTKVVIPAAGIGSRFLPLTKVVPKELLPIGIIPAIQVVVEEAMASGINNVVLITHQDKKAIQDYFDPSKSQRIKDVGKYDMIAAIDTKFKDVNIIPVYQPVMLGLGHAIMLAQEVVGNEFFGVILPDDIFFGNDPALSQLIRIAEQEHATVISVQEVPQKEVSRYGVIKIKKQLSDTVFEIEELVEKPRIEDAPSNLIINGRYVLSPKIFDSLRELFKNHTSGELQLTDALSHLLKVQGERIIAVKVSAERHDIGVPLGWIKAVITHGLNTPQFYEDLMIYLKQKIQ